MSRHQRLRAGFEADNTTLSALVNRGSRRRVGIAPLDPEHHRLTGDRLDHAGQDHLEGDPRFRRRAVEGQTKSARRRSGESIATRLRSRYFRGVTFTVLVDVFVRDLFLPVLAPDFGAPLPPPPPPPPAPPLPPPSPVPMVAVLLL